MKQNSWWSNPHECNQHYPHYAICGLNLINLYNFVLFFSTTRNDRNAILYDVSFSGKVERVPFHTLPSYFLKENHFWEGSCVGSFGTFGPKGALRSQKHVEEALEVNKKRIWLIHQILWAYSFSVVSDEFHKIH